MRGRAAGAGAGRRKEGVAVGAVEGVRGWILRYVLVSMNERASAFGAWMDGSGREAGIDVQVEVRVRVA